MFFGVLCLTFVSLQAKASGQGWSWNIGQNNPPGADYGLNFFYLGDNFGFEIGIGGIQTDETKSNGQKSDTFAINGAASLKYLFRSGQVFRPYLQAGTSSGFNVTSTNDDTSAGVGLGGQGYTGIGFFLIGNPFYFYASYNKANSSFTQFGIGFDF